MTVHVSHDQHGLRLAQSEMAMFGRSVVPLLSVLSPVWECQLHEGKTMPVLLTVESVCLEQSLK